MPQGVLVIVLAALVGIHRGEIIARTRARAASRREVPTDADGLGLGVGIPAFLDQLELALRQGNATDDIGHAQIARSSGLHGQELFRLGATIAQVVREYGDVCQTVTEIAATRGIEITPEEFGIFNLCLDDAVAEAVTAFARAHADEGAERFGSLAHELRNLLNNAVLSFDFIKNGGVDAAAGANGRIHSRSLVGLRTLIDRAIAEVRLDGGYARVERMRVHEFVADIVFGASLQAQARSITLLVPTTIEPSLGITGDRQILTSALSNILQNAIKFTPMGGTVELVVTGTADRVLFLVADQCGGLPPGNHEDLFRPFNQAGSDRSGIGLGLTIVRKAAKASGGHIAVRNVCGYGCVFTFDVPRTAPPSGLHDLQLPAAIAAAKPQ